MKEELKQFWKEHRRVIIGIAIGLVVGILILTINFWKTLLLAICILVGYIIASKNMRYRALRLLDRILPKIFRR